MLRPLKYLAAAAILCSRHTGGFFPSAAHGLGGKHHRKLRPPGELRTWTIYLTAGGAYSRQSDTYHRTPGSEQSASAVLLKARSRNAGLLLEKSPVYPVARSWKALANHIVLWAFSPRAAPLGERYPSPPKRKRCVRWGGDLSHAARLAHTQRSGNLHGR